MMTSPLILACMVSWLSSISSIPSRGTSLASKTSTSRRRSCQSTLPRQTSTLSFEPVARTTSDGSSGSKPSSAITCGGNVRCPSNPVSTTVSIGSRRPSLLSISSCAHACRCASTLPLITGDDPAFRRYGRRFRTQPCRQIPHRLGAVPASGGMRRAFSGLLRSCRSRRQ